MSILFKNFELFMMRFIEKRQIIYLIISYILLNNNKNSQVGKLHFAKLLENSLVATLHFARYLENRHVAKSRI